jgi:hypothetical protein
MRCCCRYQYTRLQIPPSPAIACHHRRRSIVTPTRPGLPQRPAQELPHHRTHQTSPALAVKPAAACEVDTAGAAGRCAQHRWGPESLVWAHRWSVPSMKWLYGIAGRLVHDVAASARRRRSYQNRYFVVAAASHLNRRHVRQMAGIQRANPVTTNHCRWRKSAVPA